MVSESWRSLGSVERADLFLGLVGRMSSRYAQGREEYGDVFQGDPLEHALEEAIDAVFYLMMALRQRESESQQPAE